jgi:glycosyltransferase involved in cell wall biosynthesis
LRILFLHEVNYLEKPIFEMHEFPEHLASRGHEVGFVQFPEGWSKSQVKAQGFRSEISGRVVAGSRITLYTPQIATGTFFGRLVTALQFGFVFMKVLDDFKPDVVVSFSVPTSGWQALRVAKKHGVPFVFRALDVSHKIRRNTISGLVLIAEKYIYKNADRVSANNRAMANYCTSMGANREKVSVELPPIDFAHFQRGLSFRLDMRSKLGLKPGNKAIVYMGSFFYFSGLPEFIEQFAERAEPSMRLVLIGGGEQEAKLRRLVNEKGLSGQVIFTGFVSFQDLPKYLAAADIAINTMNQSLVSNAAFPNKVIQYMASGLPVVSTELDGLRLTFGESPELTLVPNPRDLFDVVSKLLSKKRRRNLVEASPILLIQRNAVSRFERLCQSLADKAYGGSE